MTDSTRILHALLTRVVDVSARTRELAVSPPDHPGALAPLRDSIDSVLQVVELLEDSLARPDVPPPIPDPPSAEPDGSWLLGPGAPRS